ncbi:MAG: hypothetical protein JO352_03100 [Chloroflexi bacterium]|nr:hypothetical protein [Chloroflexota bacterium]
MRAPRRAALAHGCSWPPVVAALALRGPNALARRVVTRARRDLPAAAPHTREEERAVARAARPRVVPLVGTLETLASRAAWGRAAGVTAVAVAALAFTAAVLEAVSPE